MSDEWQPDSFEADEAGLSDAQIAGMVDTSRPLTPGSPLPSVFASAYGCGNRDVGPCVPWARFAAVVDVLVDVQLELARLRSATAPALVAALASQRPSDNTGDDSADD